MKNIPLFDLNYDYHEEEAILEVLRSKWISTGPKCIQMEKDFAQALKVDYAVGVANCTVALHLALIALGIKAGDEVILPSVTFVATANAVRYVGATPIFCDIESIERPLISAPRIEELITSKTKAIMVMHYAGFPCDMDKIVQIARNFNLRIIEDACHGPLSEYKGRKLGTIGDVGCFSFFSNKNISTGEGGLVVTQSKEIYDKLMLLRSHGMTSMSYVRAKGHATRYDVIELGYNYRMDDIHAVLAIEQLKKLPKDLETRIEIRQRYEALLDEVSEIIVPFKDNSEFVSNYIFPIVLRNQNNDIREAIRNSLSDKGVQTSVHYPLVHYFNIYQSFARDLPISESFYANEITLPMYASLQKEDIDYIIKSLKTAIKENVQ